MSLLQKLEKANPKRNVVFTAVETLTEPTQMRQFYDEYVVYLREHGTTGKVRENPESVANENIGYIAGYYSKETAVSHPIFGRDIFSVTPEQAFKAGQLTVKEGPEKTREYIQRSRK